MKTGNSFSGAHADGSSIRNCSDKGKIVSEGSTNKQQK
jgi:hypothetical protein